MALKTGNVLVVIGIGLLLAVLGYTVVSETQAGRQQANQAAEIPLVDLDPNSEQAALPSDGLEVGEVFAKLYVPRFGEDYLRNIAQGTSLSKVLNTVGVGHYEGTQMPGEVGNFAIAGHRAGNGGPMRKIDQLVAGDLVYVETANSKFTYRFLQSKIVSPEDVGVISATPKGLSDPSSSGKYLTMTTCTPIYVNTDRYVAWFELISESNNSVHK